MIEVEPPATLGCGAAGAARVAATNTGDTTWVATEGYRLVAADGDALADGVGALPDGLLVPPGDRYIFDVSLAAPASAGAYATRWTMERVGAGAFGAAGDAVVAVTCDGSTGEETGERGGPVRLDGYALVDDGGAFNALGATLMWGAWGYRHDRARLEANLAWLAANGFDYVRVLGVVGDPDAADYWDGREVSAAWSDYDEVITGLTDLAWDTYGLRVQWTLIGDGQITVPSEAEKYALVDRFLALSRGREEKILLFEIANEAWQNGFSGDEGNALLRTLTRYMRDRTDVLVAASAPAGASCADFAYVYEGDVADVATIHFDRDVSREEGAWRPVRLPWELQSCAGLPVGSNNEPIGPGSSVAEDDEPIRLASAAVTTWIAGLPFYVFHTDAGVRGFDNLYDERGADAFAALTGQVPPGVTDWARHGMGAADAPFVVYAVDGAGREHPDTAWMDVDRPSAGAVAVYAATTDTELSAVALGVIGALPLEARRAMDVRALDPLTGATVAEARLEAGQRWALSGGEAFVIRGSFR